MTQLREVADHLLDIHGQHAWQSLTRPAAVRALLDAQAGIDGSALAAAWAQWRERIAALDAARAQADSLARERERLAWQIGEVDKLAPGDGEWDELNAEHQRLAHGQALLDAARAALDALSRRRAQRRRADRPRDRPRSTKSLASMPPSSQPVVEVLRSAQAQIEDAAHTLNGYLGRSEPDPDRLGELDERLSAWVSLARRYRRPPAELPALLAGWKAELQALDAAADLGRAGTAWPQAPNWPGGPRPSACRPARARPRRSWPPRSPRRCSSSAWTAAASRSR